MPHFLTPLVDAKETYGVVIERTGAWLVDELEPAFDSATRNRGLLGRDSLPPNRGLVIAPTQAVHTFGMRFPIDIIGVNRLGRVVKMRPAVGPRRLVLAWRAFAIIELAAGQSGRAELRVGDQLQLSKRLQSGVSG